MNGALGADDRLAHRQGETHSELEDQLGGRWLLVTGAWVRWGVLGQGLPGLQLLGGEEERNTLASRKLPGDRRVWGQSCHWQWVVVPVHWQRFRVGTTEARPGARLTQSPSKDGGQLEFACGEVVLGEAASDPLRATACDHLWMLDSDGLLSSRRRYDCAGNLGPEFEERANGAAGACRVMAA